MPFRIRRINRGSATEIIFSADLQVLFSYNTPVAAWVLGRGYLRTDCRWSATTSRHISQWVRGESTEVPQAEIDAIVAGATVVPGHTIKAAPEKVTG